MFSNSTKLPYYYNTANSSSFYKEPSLDSYWCFMLNPTATSTEDKKIYFNLSTKEIRYSLKRSRPLSLQQISIDWESNIVNINNESNDVRIEEKPIEQSEKVRSVYNSVLSMQREERGSSEIFHIRQVNNFIKSTLINEYCKSGNYVLDLACGKGGDLGKWIKKDISSYVGVDIADISVEEAKSRAKESEAKVPFQFIVLDLGNENVMSHLENKSQFDIVSMQFALHYLFESQVYIKLKFQEKCNNIFNNVNESLKSGGYFIGTVANGESVLRLLRTYNGKGDKEATYSNSVSSISMSEENWVKQYNLKSNSFGVKYNFDLKESVISCDEFIVTETLLREMGRKYDLDLILYENFHSFIEGTIKKALSNPQNNMIIDLIRRLKIFNKSGTVPRDQWEIIGIYNVFVFVKTE